MRARPVRHLAAWLMPGSVPWLWLALALSAAAQTDPPDFPQTAPRTDPQTLPQTLLQTAPQTAPPTAPPTAPQTVSVRSGAHDGFDRLVLDMPGRRPWRVAPRESGASVIFEGAALRFDLGAVFERIGRQRLRAVTAPGQGGRLDLSFACACRIAAFWHAGDMLVIDVSDAAPAAPAAPAAARPRPRPLDLPLRDRLAGAGPASAPPSVAGAALAARLDARIGPRLSALPDAVPPLPASDTGLGGVQAVLGRQLGRAASQGLVTPVPGPPRPAPPPDAAAAPAPVAPAQPAGRAARPAAPGLRVTTSMDRDIARPAPAGGASQACPRPDHLDAASWGGAGPFAVELGRVNRALFGEFDTVREAEALRLARLYIHHGFGAEARQVLGWLDAGAPEVARARDLSLLVEGAPLPAGAALAEALVCGEPAVLWAILARPDLPQDAVFDHRALRRAFLALPEGVRRTLGPGLVRRLAMAGHHRTADALLRQLRGGDAPSEAGTGLARAALAARTGADAEAEAALDAVARTNAQETGLALAETIERALARAAPVEFDDAQLAGALAFEHRGTALGGRLAQAHLSALAASGAFDEAMAEFARLRASLQQEGRVASVLVRYLVGQADDVTFLRAMMTDRIVPPQALDGEVAVAVARRLLALGFPAEAARHLGPPAPAGARRIAAPDATGAARRVLRARIALAQDRPAAALSALSGLDGREAGLLRAEALAARGEHGDAGRLFAAHDAARDADRAALHTGAAEAMAGATAEPLRDLGRLLVADAPAAPAAPAAADPVLPTDATADGTAVPRALLERSTALRAAMQRLLEATPAQAATEDGPGSG